MSRGAPDLVAKARAFAQALDRDDFTTLEVAGERESLQAFLESCGLGSER